MPVGECALCIGSGGYLNCSAVVPTSNTGDNPSDCPDSLTAVKFFVQFGNGTTGRCVPFDHRHAIRRTSLVTENFPGYNDAYPGSYIVTKPFVGHPYYSSLSVGTIGLKRIACHQTEDALTCASFKLGYCINCPNSTGFDFEYRADSSPPSDEELEDFVNLCAKEALDVDGVKEGYECEDEDEEKFDMFLAAT
eukprot:TRINITY_DN3117_c0_g1_i15.p1 TRINITY_DN3117_c0_g1~~TRINITY_DN3117_c0_g1_i15.p1  ORF type:complete len:193 (+),score=27.72 TRINITY_DN3117_c0_g1_i15:291-869(+)